MLDLNRKLRHRRKTKGRIFFCRFVNLKFVKICDELDLWRTVDARLRKLLTIECILSLNICSLSGFNMELLTVESRLWSEIGEFDLKKGRIVNVKLPYARHYKPRI